MSPTPFVGIHLGLPGDDVNNSTSSVTITPENVQQHLQRERARTMTTAQNDSASLRSPVSSTLSSNSFMSDQQRSDSRMNYQTSSAAMSHSRSGSELGGSSLVSSSSAASSARTTSMVNGFHATRTKVFASQEDDSDSDDDNMATRSQAQMAYREGNYAEAEDAEDDTATSDALAAKSNRKIADLEITNKSLLAINTMLEADKHRLSKEIRDLRRRLREQRLSMPPQAYRALVRHEQRAAALSPSPGGNPASTLALPLNEGQMNIFADEDEDIADEGGDGDEEALLKQQDPNYERVTALVDALLFHAHDALAQPSILQSASLLGANDGGISTKVLSPAEVAEHYEQRRRKELGLSDDAHADHDGDVSVDHDGASSVDDEHATDPTLIPLPDASELTDSSFS